MKFTFLLSACAALAAAYPSSAIAHPVSPLQGLQKYDGPTINSVIDCNVGTKICTFNCNPILEIPCVIVGVFDSVFYGLETLIGFTVDCSEQGCNVFCPVDGALTCAANEIAGAFDSVFLIGEYLIIDGIQTMLGSIPSLGSAIPNPLSG